MRTNSITGSVVFPDGIRHAEISWNSQTGLITGVKEISSDHDEGLLIFPGFLDAHVHAREFPLPRKASSETINAWEAACFKETFSSAVQAARNGGVTAFAAMPNDPVPPDNKDAYFAKLKLVSFQNFPIVLYAALSPRSEPWGDLPYKVYLDHSPSRVAFTTWRDLESALARFKGCRVFFHAEDPEILAANSGKGPRWISRPREAEIAAIDRVLELTAKFGLKSHICHVSTLEGAAKIKEYNLRNSGRRVTCEATPHHLFFSIDGDRLLAAGEPLIFPPDRLDSNPPLRSETDRLFLLEALKQGDVDILASDHAPHTLDDKKNGAPGVPHLDTAGPFACRLLKECGFSPQRLAEIFASVPATILAEDLSVPQGKIEEGFNASFTLLDLDAVSSVDDTGIKNRGRFKTRCGWSPFSGTTLPGKVALTVVAGQLYDFE